MTKKRNPVAKQFWKDKRYMNKVCKSKKEKNEYEKVLKRMDREYEETYRGYILQYKLEDER